MAERNNTSAAGQEENTSSKRPPWWKRSWRWMGFGETKLWDWLQLPNTLAMPIVVADPEEGDMVSSSYTRPQTVINV